MKVHELINTFCDLQIKDWSVVEKLDIVIRDGLDDMDIFRGTREDAIMRYGNAEVINWDCFEDLVIKIKLEEKKK